MKPVWVTSLLLLEAINRRVLIKVHHWSLGDIFLVLDEAEIGKQILMPSF
jgi:hypothetical protein